MAIGYKSAGSGVSTETSGAALSPACPATVDAGDILIAHVFWEGTTTAPSTPSGWTLLDGPRVIETTIARHWVFGKVADGTEDGATAAFGSPAVTTQRAARIYSFSGRVSGDISLLCQGFSHQSHATDPQAPTVTTLRAGALAVALVGQNDNNTIGDFTGESGGNWTEAVAEYTANLTPGLALQIQTCTPTSNPGTVSGGTFNTTNDPVGVIGFYIQDVAETPKSATDTVAVAATDAQQAPVVTVASSESILGFADDWRVLTNSDTFTYHNRTDSLLIRLNGSDAGAGGTVEVSVADSISAGSTDTFTGAQAFSVSDSIVCQIADIPTISSSCSAADSLGVTASVVTAIASTCTVTDSAAAGLTEGAAAIVAVLVASDSLPVQLSEAVQPVSVSLRLADSLTAGLTDTFTGSQALSVVESLSCGLTESASCVSSVSASDSAAIQLSEAVTQVAAVLTVVDTLSVGVSDVIASALVSAVASDSLKAGLSDTFTGSQAFTIQDSLAAQLSEAITTTVSASASDAVAVLLDDVGVLSQVTISASESLTAGLSEAANVIQNTLLSVSENLVTGLTESATLTQALTTTDSVGSGLSDVFIGSQALGVSDLCSSLLSEDQSSSLLTAALDGVATSLSEAASVYLTQAVVDALAVQYAEVGTRQDVEAAIPKSASDSCSISLDEGAVTEIAGPYWTGGTGEDRGLVYADSYSMGRRENPGRMRW